MASAAAEKLAAAHNATVGDSPPAAGHNSANQYAKDQLKSFIERVERLADEKKAIADDIRDVLVEAKSNGYDVKALRTIIKERAQDADERREQEAILDTYRLALGMI